MYFTIRKVLYKSRGESQAIIEGAHKSLLHKYKLLWKGCRHRPWRAGRGFPRIGRAGSRKRTNWSWRLLSGWSREFYPGSSSFPKGSWKLGFWKTSPIKESQICTRIESPPKIVHNKLDKLNHNKYNLIYKNLNYKKLL